MKIVSVGHNNRRKGFDVRTRSGSYWFPYAKLGRMPGRAEPVAVVRSWVDEELGREAFSYCVKSGKEGTVHIEQVLEYNSDPAHMRQLLLYELTMEAQRRVDSSAMSKREIVRRLGTSAPQLYRLLDQTFYGKTIDSMLALLGILDCEVDLTVRSKTA